MLAIIPKKIVTPEGSLVLNPHDPIISGMLMFGIFEPYEIDLFRNALTPGITVIDIGANIGLFTIIAAHHVGPSGKVFAFEPEPQNFSLLQENVTNNNYTNVTLHQRAISDKPGLVTLHLYDANKGKHSLVKDVSDAPGFNTSVDVEAIDLDSFMERERMIPDIIKMDIEGAESLALAGMKHTLRSCKKLFIEFTPDSIQKVGHDPKQVLTTLSTHGFTISVINEGTKTLEEANDYDALIAGIAHAHAVNLYCVRSLKTKNL